LHSAVFESFNGDLCDQVLERTGSALLLERVAARELFLQPVEQRPGWFRYHTLLRDFLLNRLRLEQPQRIGEIHQRAARYYLAHGQYEAALCHARDSDDHELFTALLARSFD